MKGEIALIAGAWQALAAGVEERLLTGGGFMKGTGQDLDLTWEFVGAVIPASMPSGVEHSTTDLQPSFLMSDPRLDAFGR